MDSFLKACMIQKRGSRLLLYVYIALDTAIAYVLAVIIHQSAVPAIECQSRFSRCRFR